MENNTENYEISLSRNDELMQMLHNEIVPHLVQNVGEHMGEFISAYKEIKMLQTERIAELQKFAMEKEYNLEKFTRLADKTQDRLSKMLDQILSISNQFINMPANSDQDVQFRNVLLTNMSNLQNQYLTELHLLMNL